MNFLEEARKVIRNEIIAVEGLADRLDSNFENAVTLLRDTLSNQSRIIVVGVGKSGNIGRKLVATLNSTGAPCTHLNAQDALHGDLGTVQSGDTIIALSTSGETQELLDLLPHLKALDTKIIGITGNLVSSLARTSDIILDAGIDNEACPLGLAPTASTTVALVLCDALAMVLVKARGFSADDFAKLHPGGSIGRALLVRVSDIMRKEGNFPSISHDTSIKDTLAQMNQHRCGAAIISDANYNLLGIFTHGDFVRAYRENNLVGEQPVSNHMTKNPISIKKDRLASEIRPLLVETPVDDIVVLDEKNLVCGLVDTVDLAPLGI